MSPRSSVIGAAILALAALAMPSSGHAQVSKDECKCQTATAKAQGKFVASKAKCVTKCEQGARKGKNPDTDCNPPYAGTTAACVQKAEDKAITSEAKCKDCPECYSGGDCFADAQSRTATNEAQLDVFVPLIYCNDAASGDGLNANEAKCQDGAAKALSGFVDKKSKCYQKCRSLECAGKVPAGSCTPPASDPKTAECVAKEEAKASASCNKACADAPECYPANACTTYTAAVEGVVDSGYASTYCGSPSGAFTR